MARLLAIGLLVVLVLIGTRGPCVAFTPFERKESRARREPLAPAPARASPQVEITSVVVEAEASVSSYADRWIQQALDDAGYQHTISYWLSASLEERGDHPDRCFPLPEWIRDMDHATTLEITPRCDIDWQDTLPLELRFDDDAGDGEEDEDEDRWWEKLLPDRRIEIGSRGNSFGSNIVMPNPPRPLKWGKQLLRFEIEY